MRTWTLDGAGNPITNVNRDPLRLILGTAQIPLEAEPSFVRLHTVLECGHAERARLDLRPTQQRVRCFQCRRQDPPRFIGRESPLGVTLFEVWRHDGQAASKWRVLYKTDDRSRALAIFHQAHEVMLRGGLELYEGAQRIMGAGLLGAR